MVRCNTQIQIGSAKLVFDPNDFEPNQKGHRQRPHFIEIKFSNQDSVETNKRLLSIQKNKNTCFNYDVQFEYIKFINLRMSGSRSHGDFFSIHYQNKCLIKTVENFKFSFIASGEAQLVVASSLMLKGIGFDPGQGEKKIHSYFKYF